MSELSSEIIDKIFSGDKSSTVDAIDNALSNRALELIQQKKFEFAKQWGFELDQTGQEAADELELPDGTEGPVDYEVDGRMPHEAPDDEVTTEEESEEEIENETDL